MTFQEVFHHAATMDRMFVPHQHDRACNLRQQVLEKGDHFVATDRVPIGLNVQLDLAFSRTHPHRTDQIEAFFVLDTGADGRRLSAWRPGALQWADQRKPAFIGKNQGGSQRLPLFLSAARYSVSNGQPLHRRVPTCAVVVFGNSTPNAVTHTTHRSAGSAPQTAPRSAAQSDPRSSNLQHGRRHTPRAARPAPNSAVGKRTSGGDALARTAPACASALESRDASVAHCVWSCRSVCQPARDCVRVVTMLERADDVVTIVWPFRKVSCIHYRI